MLGSSIAAWTSAPPSPGPTWWLACRIGDWTCSSPESGTARDDSRGMRRGGGGWVAESRAEGRGPVVVGGTGLYIRALADGLFNEPVLDPDRREQLREWSSELEAGELVRWAGRLDAGFPGGGRQRAARAIEVALLTGRAL